MPRQVIRLSEGLGGALLLLLAVSLTVLLAFVLAVNESPFPENEPLDELVLATDTPFWVAGQPVVSTATPEPTAEGNTAVPTLFPTAVVPGTSPTPTITIICPAPPPGWQPYTVQSSDSLTGVAVQNGVTSSELMRVNCLTTAVLYVGMTIYLPSQAPTRVACGPPASWGRYLVQRGDTLYSLALRYGTNVYQIMNANCMVGTGLTAGRYIYLPPTAVVPATPTPLPPTTPLPTLTPTAPPPPPATEVPPTPTATFTPLPPTPTNTPFPTLSPVPATATFTPVPPPPATATFTPVPPPPATATFTPVPPTATPTATFTPEPPPPTATATFTPVPPTATATFTPVPPTATATATFTPEPLPTATMTVPPAP